jgi:magnesium chelatase family protein
VTFAAYQPRAVRTLAMVDSGGIDYRHKFVDRSAIERLGLSGRTYDRLLRVARTLADLEGCAGTAAGHVAEALQFRAVPAAE